MQGVMFDLAYIAYASLSGSSNLASFTSQVKIRHKVSADVNQSAREQRISHSCRMIVVVRASCIPNGHVWHILNSVGMLALSVNRGKSTFHIQGWRMNTWDLLTRS